MDKYVKLMADYSASGLWNHEGCAMALHEVPLSDELYKAIDDWVMEYDLNCTNYLPEDHEDYREFDHVTHNKVGEELAARIKAELPDWEVVYWGSV